MIDVNILEDHGKIWKILSLYKEDYLQIFKCVSFWLHGCCG